VKMEYYENQEKIEKYIKFEPSHDGSILVDILVAALPEGGTVLELGMGPGKDFKRLSRHFEVTGSDFSNLFLELFRQHDEQADLLHLDARTLDTDRSFDGIFSNKALIHLSDRELRRSFSRQNEVLNDAGLIYKVLGKESSTVRTKVREFWSLVRPQVTGFPVPPEFPWR